MMQMKNINALAIIVCTVLLSACGGLRTFHEFARAGDTVAVPTGLQTGINRGNINVIITPSSGPDIVLDSNSPEIRAIINLYPDPVSNMIVSREIGEDTSQFSTTYADSLLVSANFDKDWYQTTVFIDLPAGLPQGLTELAISNGVEIVHTATVDIIPGQGTPNTFSSDFNGGLLISEPMLDSLARAAQTTVELDSTEIPHAVELNFTHDADKTAGGTGKATVINPLGYRKNLFWHDDGTNLKIVMMQSKDSIIDDMKDFKFYIAGTVTNLQFSNLNAYDINGNDLLNVSATLTTN